VNSRENAEVAAKPGRVLGILFAGVLIGALDIAIVGPALPALGQSFGVDERSLAWVISIFVLFNLIGAPALAKLSDRVGRRHAYILSLALFTSGSTLVALAPSFAWLLVARAIQAVGAGGIFPVASAVIADVFPVERRGKALGLIGAVFGIAFVLGPILGGLLLPVGWQWLFLVNVPIGLLLMLAAARVLPSVGTGGRGAFDTVGSALLATALVLVAYGVNSIDTEQGVRALLAVSVWPCLVGGVLACVALWRAERRAADPILPPRMWTGQLRLIGGIAFVTGIVEAGMVFLPTLAVTSFDVTPAAASFMLLPLVAALIVGAPSAGALLDLVGARPVIQLGLCLMAAGLLTFGLASIVRSSFYAGGGLIGLGLASLLGAPLRYAALNEAGQKDRGASQGWLTLHLGAGQLIGAALIGATVVTTAGDLVAGFQRAMLLLALGCGAGLALGAGLRPGKAGSRGEPERRS
jgi:MFS family permease